MEQRPAHVARGLRSNLCSLLLPGRRFPFPKSLYAVEDALRFVVADKPDAADPRFLRRLGHDCACGYPAQQAGRWPPTVHLVSRTTRFGRRAERPARPGPAARVTPSGRPLGICDHITKPRIKAAITGRTPDGEPIKGDYRFTDEFPIADGFEENVEFFTLTYEAPVTIAHNRAFERHRSAALASRPVRKADVSMPLPTASMWPTPTGFSFDLDYSAPLLQTVEKSNAVRIAFIVTDDDRAFQLVCADFRHEVEPVRLYESYLTNFTINTGGSERDAVHAEGLPGRRRRRRSRNLARRPRRLASQDGDPCFSLTATTGAGKTVMAAAVIEALFDGNDDFDFAADPGAVVLWFTDDPSLNEQTRFRLMEAGDRIAYSRPRRHREHLQPGEASSRARSTSSTRRSLSQELAARARERPRSAQDALVTAMPSSGSAGVHDVGHHPEHHRGRAPHALPGARRGPPRHEPTSEATALTSRPLSSDSSTALTGIPPVPVVWGISATVERFNTAMADAEGRLTLPVVDRRPGRVQESGLLKDDIRLDFPAETGLFDTVLLRARRRKIERVHRRCGANTPKRRTRRTTRCTPTGGPGPEHARSDDLLLAHSTTIHDEWPDSPPDAHRPCLRRPHGASSSAGTSSRTPAPRRCRTGPTSGCCLPRTRSRPAGTAHGPRSSSRSGRRPTDTHITQLLGRMVRTPLARRIPGNDRLNSVECVLPHFNRKTATDVAECCSASRPTATTEPATAEAAAAAESLSHPSTCMSTTAIPDARVGGVRPAPVADAAPQGGQARQAAQRARPSALARRAAAPRPQGCLRRAVRRARRAHRPLQGQDRGGAATRSSKSKARRSSRPSAARRMRRPRSSPRSPTTARSRPTSRQLAACSHPTLPASTPTTSRSPTEDDDGLFDAHVKVAALAKVDGVQAELDRDADALATKWLGEHRVAIKALGDERRAVYDEVIAHVARAPAHRDPAAARASRGDQGRRRQSAADQARTPHGGRRAASSRSARSTPGSSASWKPRWHAAISWPGTATPAAHRRTRSRSPTRTATATGEGCAPTSSSFMATRTASAFPSWTRTASTSATRSPSCAAWPSTRAVRRRVPSDRISRRDQGQDASCPRPHPRRRTQGHPRRRRR